MSIAKSDGPFILNFVTTVALLCSLGYVTLDSMILPWARQTNAHAPMAQTQIKHSATEQSFENLIGKVDDNDTLERAYRWTRVERIPFVAEHLDGTREEREFLRALFAITDRGVLYRVQKFMYVQGQIKNSPPAEFDREVLEQLSALRAPPRLAAVHHKIILAVDIQKGFLKDFVAWRQLTNDPRVRAADQPLHDAYALLLETFKTSSVDVQSSFYSHLCALSLI